MQTPNLEDEEAIGYKEDISFDAGDAKRYLKEIHNNNNTVPSEEGLHKHTLPQSVQQNDICDTSYTVVSKQSGSNNGKYEGQSSNSKPGYDIDTRRELEHSRRPFNEDTTLEL
ncbi:hypothetical protein H5410_062633 [Solanum commersonii]|uniref:Uncharacterized protein n=1 Tax=Solanum commersonii TaxID=4109 RepID=A0A9J5WAX1_SOLCO|nr:hypothetical protein H5410_062633 [Solanum commersonii]